MGRQIFLGCVVIIILAGLLFGCGRTGQESSSAVIKLIQKEANFFSEGNWESLYRLYSPGYKRACPYSKFVELSNESLAGMRMLYPQGKLAPANIKVAIKGDIAYATYVDKLGNKVIESVTETNPDVFIKVNGKWYDTADDPSDPGYNKEDVKVEQETVVWQVPKEFPTIQSAIDVVRPGVTVLVSKGVYKENLKIERPVTLKATGKVVIQAADIDKSVISLKKEAGNWWNSSMSSAVKGDLVIDGFVLQGGKKGVSIEGPSLFELGTLMPVTLERSTIQNNAEDGVYVTGRVKTTLIDCTIRRNRSYGVVLYANVSGKPSATLDHCTITDNKYGLGFLYGSATGGATPVNTLDTIAGSNNRIYGNSVQDLVPETGWPTGFGGPIPPSKPPLVTITSPKDNSTFSAGEMIYFQGKATDPEDGALTGSSLVWTSSIDGQIGTGGSFSTSLLSVGTHTITLTATDSDGDSASASINITVGSAGPTPPPPGSSKGKIAFVSSCEGDWDIYVMNADGSDQHNITNDPNYGDWGPTWSPDGTKIAFILTPNGNRGIYVNKDIYVMNADGSDPHNITNDPANWDEYPAWSPDGTKIAFESNRDGNWEIYVMNADGSDPRNITNDPDYDDEEPTWSPDGTKIAFVSSRGNSCDEIYVINANGSDPHNITNDPDHGDWDPTWSPDGTKIAFQSDRDDNWEIYVMNADGSDPHNITNDPGHGDEEPAWSPDGTKIAFQSDRDDNWEIYVMNADGSDPHNITNDPGHGDWGPAWSPVLSYGEEPALPMAPDLSISSVSLSTSFANPGDNVSVTFTVKNNGGPVSEEFQNRVFLSSTSYGRQGGHKVLLGEFPMSLDGSTSKTQTVNVVIPQVSAGNWYIVVYTDCNETIDETNENNNIDSAEISIGTPGGPVAPNEPPSVTIISPKDNSTFSAGEMIYFQGKATDPEDGALTGSSLVWTSSIDGQIGTGGSFSTSLLSVGTHTITLTATDSDGDSASASINITVGSAGPTSPPLGPSEEKIAFVSDRDGNCEIYVMNADGSDPHNISNDHNYYDLGPAWSPDGAKIAFEAYHDGHWDIYVMNADGSDQHNITNDPGNNDGDPAWSPDGTKIAFASDRDARWVNSRDIYVMNADGSGPHNITNDPDYDDEKPAWSPDGTKIAFASDRDGNWDIYVMNADGSGPHNISNDSDHYDWGPAWSPDGTKIAFQSNRLGRWEIYVMNTDGSDQHNITNDSDNDDRWPVCWSPDGTKIAFVSSRGNSYDEIYVMNANGSDPHNITNDPDHSDEEPAWSPKSLR